MPLLPAAGYATPSAPTVEPSPVPLTPYQDIRPPVEAFGGATAQALSGFGAALGKTAEHLESTQQFYDQVVVDEQKNSYENKVNNKLYGDPAVAGDVGYMGLQGKNALEAREGVRKDIDAMLSDHRSTLKNANQLRLFDHDASRYRNATLNQVGRHYDEQYNKYAAETANSTYKLKLHEGAVASNNNDFPRLKAALESSLVAGEQALRLQGASPESIALHRATTVQAFTATWAFDAIERNAPEGKQFVLDHKDELGDKYDELLHKATTASTQYDVERMKNGLPPVTSQPNLVRGGAVGSFSVTPHVNEAVAEFKKAGWTQAAIEGALANGLAEGGFNEPWKQALSGERSFGHWQYYANGELPGFQRTAGSDQSTAAQARYLISRMEELHPGYGRITDARQATDIVATKFERYQGAAPGQRYGHLETVQRALSGGSTPPMQPASTAGTDQPSALPSAPSPWVPTTGPDNKTYMLTRPQAEQYKVIEKSEDKQKFLAEAIKTPVPLSTAAPSTAPAPAKAATPEAGVQTLARDLRRQAAGSGEPITIRGLAAAGATPDTVDAKVDTAVKHTGFGPDQPLDLAKPQVLAKTLEAITLVRTGKLSAEDKQVITRAVNMKPEDVATPTVAQTPGATMPSLPPNEAGELPDGEVPGLLEKLKQGAKLLPPNAKPEVWNAYVRSVRQDANLAYQQQMHQERQRTIAQQHADQTIGDQYYERIAPGSTNMPSEAEILKDTRISQEKRKDIINVMHALNKRDPDPATANNNMVEAYKGLGLKEGEEGRIYRKEQIDQLYTDKKITWDMRRELQSHLEAQQGAKRQYVQPHITQLLKDSERVLFPLKHMKDGVGLQMDPDAPMRERRYQNFVENTVQDYITQGKDVRKLFDPGSPDKPNPEYLGNRALLDEFGKGAKQFGRGQTTGSMPAEGELKSNTDIGKAHREGRFGVFGTPEALEAAKQYSIRAGLGGRRVPTVESGVPLR